MKGRVVLDPEGGCYLAAVEDKQEICELLCRALQATANAWDLKELRYDEDEENVYVVFEGGTRVVNVAMDSGTAMIRDIMTHLGC